MIADGVAEGLQSQHVAFRLAHGLNAASMLGDVGANCLAKLSPLLFDRHCNPSVG